MKVQHTIMDELYNILTFGNLQENKMRLQRSARMTEKQALYYVWQSVGNYIRKSMSEWENK